VWNGRTKSHCQVRLRVSVTVFRVGYHEPVYVVNPRPFPRHIFLRYLLSFLVYWYCYEVHHRSAHLREGVHKKLTFINIYKIGEWDEERIVNKSLENDSEIYAMYGLCRDSS